jgi:CDP-glucose 4,6-dehydratase
VGRKTLSIRHPQAIRPWQHVLNSLSGYLVLIEKLAQDPKRFSGPWNFGPNKRDCQSVLSVVNSFKEKWGVPFKIRFNRQTKFKEKMLLQLDCAKAARYLKWKPVWNLETALDKTAEWFRAYVEKENLEEICLRQIKQFQIDS